MMEEKKVIKNLIEVLRSDILNDEELGEIASILDRIVPDPNYWSYTIDSEPELSADEIVNKAFSYKPILL